MRGGNLAGNVALSVRRLSKRFRIPHRKRTTLFEEITSIGRRTTYETFFALKDVSLAIRRGEFVGILGDNGSGKSTLLKIIAGILVPSEGSIAVDGQVATLLELGAGFQQEMTAKENLFLYGAIMGMSRRQIRRKQPGIVSFAGLERFMDTRLKDFSSGMRARLAFSIAIHSDFDILLVDEALAVGDQQFRERCYRVFEQFKGAGKTILLVSHDPVVIRRFCTRTVLLERGSVIHDGDVEHGVSMYLSGKGRGSVR